METLRIDWPLIVGYHSVSDSRTDNLAVRVEDFDAQIAWLRRRGYRSLTLGDFLAGKVDAREPVAIITFDDGYEDNHRLALPVLERHGFVATFFVVTDFLGSDRLFPWDREKLGIDDDPAPFRVLDWDQVRDMRDRGFEIGSHTCTHPRELTALAPEACREELVRSRRALEERLGQPIVSFCYPRGNLNDTVMHAVEAAGYAGAVVTPTRWGHPLTPYTLRRIGVYQHNSPLVFRLKTTRWLRRNYERLHWLRGRRS